MIGASAKQIIWGLLVSLAVAVAIGGCGGGDSNAGAADSSSKAEKAAFIKKADARCIKVNDEQVRAVKAYDKKHPGETDPENQRLLTVVLPNIRENMEQLDEMPPPSGDEAAVKAIVVANEKAVEKTEAHPEGTTAGSRTYSPFYKGTQLSMAYGFKVCGQY